MKNETNTMATKNDNGATPRFSQRQLQAEPPRVSWRVFYL